MECPLPDEAILGRVSRGTTCAPTPDGVEYEYENPVGSVEGGAAWNDIPMAPIDPLSRNERMNFQNLCNAS